MDLVIRLRFPSWIGTLGNLVSLQLRHCYKCMHLLSLGALTSFKKLELWFVNEVQYMDDDESSTTSTLWSTWKSNIARGSSVFREERSKEGTREDWEDTTRSMGTNWKMKKKQTCFYLEEWVLQFFYSLSWCWWPDSTIWHHFDWLIFVNLQEELWSEWAIPCWIRGLLISYIFDRFSLINW